MFIVRSCRTYCISYIATYNYVHVQLVTHVTVLHIHLIGGVDYKSGPYHVNIKRRKHIAKFCIGIIDDAIPETDEIFGLTIDADSLPSGVNLANPYTANVTLVDNEGMSLSNLGYQVQVILN